MFLNAPHRIDEVEEICTYTDPDAQHRIKWHLAQGNEWASRWDGKVKLYSVNRTRNGYQYTIPSGFEKPIVAYLQTLPMHFSHDNRFKKHDGYIEDSNIKKLVRLRDDRQKEAGKRIKEANGRGIIEAVTGFGKTVLGISTIQRFRNPTIILADRKVIIEQWDEQVQKYFKLYRFKSGSIHLYTSTKWNSFKEALKNYESIAIMITTPKMVRSAMENPTTWRNEHLISWLEFMADHLIYDEVHNAGSDTSIDVLRNIDVYAKLGFSATVMSREDNRDLEYVAQIGTIIYTILQRQVHERKSIPLKFLKVGSVFVRRREKYADIYNKAVIMNRQRNDIIVDVIDDMMMEQRRILVLIDHIEHARILSDMSGFPYTYANDKDRKEKFIKFQSGNSPVLICTYKLVGEGYDHPELDTIILAGTGKAKNKEIQAVGRVMRKYEGKQTPKIFDFADTTDKLRDQTIKRLNIWVDEHIYDIDVSDTFLSRYMR